MASRAGAQDDWELLVVMQQDHAQESSGARTVMAFATGLPETTRRRLKPHYHFVVQWAWVRKPMALTAGLLLAALLVVACPSMATFFAQRRHPFGVKGVAHHASRPAGSTGHAASTGTAPVAVLVEQAPHRTGERLAPSRREMDKRNGSWHEVVNDVVVTVGTVGESEEEEAKGKDLTEKKKNITWQVVHPDFVNVRSGPHIWTRIIEMKKRCMQITGVASDGWVKLANEPGYIVIRSNGRPLVKKSAVTYSRINTGTCSDYHRYPINDRDSCNAAALALGLADTVSHVIRDNNRPEGCYWLGGALFYSENPKNTGNGADMERQQLCSSRPKPVLDPCHGGSDGNEMGVKPPRTGMIPSIPEEIDGLKPLGPESLFCFTVILMTGYAPVLIKAQFENMASIFTCDKYMVLSSGGHMTLGQGWNTTAIAKPSGGFKGKKGGAELNMPELREMFLRAWDKIMELRVYRLTAWTVKVDPDTVFFPARLVKHLRQSAAKEGARTYFLNCNRYPGPPKLFGSVEIFSREAIQRFADGKERCSTAFGWHKDWAEEMYLQQCMTKLGATALFDGSMVGDDRCWSAPCTDETKVAIHSYMNQDPENYMQCWDEATEDTLTSLLPLSPEDGVTERK